MASSEEDLSPVEGEDAPKKHQRICKVRERTNAGRNKQGNALQKDKKLKEMLDSADDINSLEHFDYWKDEFLAGFRKFLDPDGTATAREADDELCARMQKLTKILVTLKQLCSDGGISEERVSVKGQNSLNEFVAEMASLEKAIKLYWPKTNEDEEKVGYTKFELAAVLVRDGFRIYDVMLTTRNYLINLRDGPLKGEKFLTPNSRSIINYYLKELDSFCDSMADLGLFKLMSKMLELYKVRPRKKKKKKFDRKTMDPLSDTSNSDTINHGRMFRRSKVDFKSVIDKGWKAGVTGEEVHEQNKIPEDGEDEVVVTGKVPEEEEEPEEETEFIYYFDPVTEKVGKIPRRQCLSENLMIRRNEKGEEVQEGAAEKWEGEEGKSMLIWKLKEALKGKSLKKEGNKQPEGKRTSTKQ